MDSGPRRHSGPRRLETRPGRALLRLVERWRVGCVSVGSGGKGGWAFLRVVDDFFEPAHFPAAGWGWAA